MLRKRRVLPTLFVLITLELLTVLASPSNAIGPPPPMPIMGENVSLEEAARLARNTGFTLERPDTLPSDLKYLEVRVVGSRIIDVQRPWVEGLSEALLIYSKEPVNPNTTLQDVLSSGGLLIIEQKRLPAFDEIVDAALRAQGKVGETRTTTVNGSVITSVRTGAVEAVTINGNRGALITTSKPYVYVNQSLLQWGNQQLAVELLAGLEYYTKDDLVTIASSFTNATAPKTPTPTTTTTTTNTSSSVSTSKTISTSTQPEDNGFSSAVAKVSRAYAVQVAYAVSSENQKIVTIESKDSRFNEIMKYLSNSTVNRVTQKYRVTTEGNVTTTISVTVLYPHGYYLTFMLWNGSTVHFSLSGYQGDEAIWFETGQAIYRLSFDPAFNAFLNNIVQESVKTTITTITGSTDNISSATTNPATSVETATKDEANLLIYAWAVGATIVATVLAVILSRRTSQTSR